MFNHFLEKKTKLYSKNKDLIAFENLYNIAYYNLIFYIILKLNIYLEYSKLYLIMNCLLK